jgi:hypothetical protein
MADEGKLREQASRGANARRILESELVQDVFAKMDDKIVKSIRESVGDESDIRERAYLMLRLLENFKAEFKTMVLTGDAASAELLRVKDPNQLQRMLKNVRRY